MPLDPVPVAPTVSVLDHVAPTRSVTMAWALRSVTFSFATMSRGALGIVGDAE